MRRIVLVSAAALVALTFSAAAFAGECCDKSKSTDGYCCGTGYFAGLTIKSEKLHTALVGQKVNAYKMKCASCKKALKTDGECKSCGVSFAGKKAYKSAAAAKLAKGKAVNVSAISCPGCKKAASGAGQCCGTNYVGQKSYKNDASYREAKEALALVKLAAASKCEDCAVAMVTDGKCASCNLSFKNGKPTKKTVNP